MGNSMNIQQKIEHHKSGKVQFQQMPSPQYICKSDDDYIAYAVYAWQAIEEMKKEFAIIDFYSELFCVFTNHITRDINTAHLIINYCYNHLKSNGEAVKPAEVYTTTMAHENYVKRRG